MTKRALILSFMVVMVLLVAAPAPLFAVCPGVIQPTQHAFGGSFKNCSDRPSASAPSGQVSGFIYVVDPAVGSVCPNSSSCNTASLDVICEDSTRPNAQGGVCQLEAGAPGDGNVTVSMDWGAPGPVGCPNINGRPDVGRNVVQVIANDGSSIVATVGYSVELAMYAIDCAGPPTPAGLGEALSCSFHEGVNFVSNDGTTLCANQPVPKIYSDCDPGTMCGPGNALGINPTCATPSSNPTSGRGRLYRKDAECGTSPDPLLSTGWTLVAAPDAITGTACIPVPRAASGLCAYVGATATVGGSETLAVQGALQVAGQSAPSARALSVRAAAGGRDIIVTWRTDSELDLGGFNVLAEKKGKGFVTVSAAMIAPKGANGAGASYEVRIPRATFQGGRTIYVESVLTTGSKILSDPAKF